MLPPRLYRVWSADGTNFATETTSVTETTVSSTQTVRFAVAQNVAAESASVDYANIEVFAPAASPTWRALSAVSTGVTFTSYSGPVTPQYSQSGTVLSFNPCPTGSCTTQGNMAVLVAEIATSAPITGVRGSFVEAPLNSGDHPDDCHPTYSTSAHTAWYPNIGNYDGYFMFGTPDTVLYGGCACTHTAETACVGLRLACVGLRWLVRWLRAEPPLLVH
jgi:hypothetical protein